MSACNESKISTKTGSRWLEQYHATGSILPVRHRDAIAGQMPYEDQEALFTLIANNRTAHIDELTQLLLEDTGHFHTERLVRQIVFRQKYSCKLANHMAPLERVPELRRYLNIQLVRYVEILICFPSVCTTSSLEYSWIEKCCSHIEF